jgi:hypothetical protein
MLSRIPLKAERILLCKIFQTEQVPLCLGVLKEAEADARTDCEHFKRSAYCGHIHPLSQIKSKEKESVL